MFRRALEFHHQTAQSSSVPLVQGDASTFKVEWTSDSDLVVLEISTEGSRSVRDADPCTLRDMWLEMEGAGIIDVTLNSHTIQRPDGLINKFGS